MADKFTTIKISGKEYKVNLTMAKKAVKEYNAWDDAAIIYYDMADGEVWTNTYSGCNTWDRYHAKSIIDVASKNNLPIRDMSLDELLDKIEHTIDVLNWW